MEELDYIIKTKEEIKSLRIENETLQNDLVEANREIDRLKRKTREANEEIDRLKRKTIEANEEIARLNDELKKTNNEIAKRNAIIEGRNKVIHDVAEIVYEDKYEEWARAGWRLMERTDFEEFLRRLKSILK